VSFSVLLRLLPGPLAAGCLVGELEVVATGERALVRSTEELVAYLRVQAFAAPRSAGRDTEDSEEKGACRYDR